MNQKSSNQKYAVELDTAMKRSLVAELTKVPGVIKVIDYSNSDKRTASPKPWSDLDLIIVLDDNTSLKLFKETFEYYLVRYQSLFRHTPWMIPASLWQEYLSAKPYNTPKLTKFMATKQVSKEKLFFTYYELLLDSFFSALNQVLINHDRYFFPKYLYRTKLQLLECLEYFYTKEVAVEKIKAFEKLSLDQSPVSSLHILKHGVEELSKALAERISLTLPKEQVLLPYGWRSPLFFISPRPYAMIKNYFLLKGTTSFRVLNIAILAYSYGLSSGLSANSTSKQTSTNPVEPYQIEFNRRKAMIQKWLAFRAKHDLQKISSSPYGYSLLEAKILHF